MLSLEAEQQAAMDIVRQAALTVEDIPCVRASGGTYDI